MSEERLRLIAEFRDNASGGVRRLGRELGEIRTTPGMNAAQRWMKGFTVDAEKIQRNAAGVGSIMGAMGIGGAAAAGGIAAAVGALKAFGDRTIELQAVARETGLTLTQLKTLQNFAKGMHVDPEQLTKGVQFLTGQLAQARRGYGELYGLLNQLEPKFMEKIMNDDPAKAIDDVLKRLAQIPSDYVAAGKSLADGIAAQKQYAQAMLGDPGLGRLVQEGPKAFADAMAEAQKNTAPLTKNMVDAAKEMDKAIRTFDESLDNLETKAAPTLFKGLAGIVGELNTTVDTLDRLAKWWDGAKDKPGQIAEDATNVIQDQVTLSRSQNHDRLHREGLFAPAEGDAARARLEAMTAEVDAIKRKLGDDHNPVSFPARHADDFSRLAELGSALRIMREEHPDLAAPKPVAPIPQPAPRPAPPPRASPSTDMREQGLLQLNAYHEGDDRPARAGFGGMSPNMVMLWRELIASGVKAGFLAAVQEAQGEGAPGGLGGGGLSLASYGNGSTGGAGAGSGRYRAAGGRSFGGSAASAGGDFGPVPTGAHTPLKDLIAQHETGGTGAAGYDTAYGHAEQPGSRLHALAPPKPLTQMTIAEVLDYQHRMKPIARSPAFPVGRAQWVEKTLRGLTRGMDPNTIFSPEVQEKLFDKSIAGRMDQGVGGFRSEWDSLRGVSANQIQAAIEGHRTAMASASASMPRSAGAGSSVKGLIHGALQIGGETFHYGSGGAGGSSSIPFGDYPINPNSGNPWGRAHDAMDVNNTGSIWDSALGRMRTGIEMHAAHTAEMVTHGCLGFLKDEYPRLKARVQQMVREHGHAYLHIGENGATIDSSPDGERLTKAKTDLAAHANSTASAAHRLLTWAGRAAHLGAQPRVSPEAQPRPSLFEKGGMSGAQTVRHEGGAVVEIRGLPQGKGTRTETSGMISAVNLRRGGPVTQIG